MNIINSNSDIQEKTGEEAPADTGLPAQAQDVGNEDVKPAPEEKPKKKKEEKKEPKKKIEKRSFGPGAILLMLAAAAFFVVVCGWLSLKLNINGSDEEVEKPVYGELGCYYGALSANEKQLYREIAYCVDNAVNMSEILPLGVTEAELNDVLNAIYRDECDMFYLDIGACYADTSGDKSVVTLAYRYDSPTISRMRSDLAAAADAAAGEIRDAAGEGDDISVILALHDILASKCVKASEEGANVSNAYGALVEGAADAEGYAYAARELLKRFGIESAVVFGSEGDSPHVWNIVRAGDEWYHLDCYFDDADAELDPGIPFHAWFMIGDDSLGSRIADTGIALPECGGSFDYYKKYGYTCDSADTLSGILNTAVNEADHDGKKYIELKAPADITEEELLDMTVKIIKDHNGSRTASMTPAPYAEARIYDSGMPGVYTIQLYY